MPPKTEVSSTLHQGAVYKPSSELKIESCGAQTMLKEGDEGMDCGDWEREFESLERLRAVVVYAPELLTQEDYVKETLPRLIRRIDAQTNNLRSQIVKNALMLLEEMFRHMGPTLAKFMNSLVPCVVKRCADQNKFLAEAADTTMASLLDNCSPAKILKAVFPCLPDKDQKIRNAAVAMLAQAVAKLAPSDAAYTEFFEKIVAAVGPLLYDNSEKARSSARQTVITLIQNAVATSSVGELKKTYTTLVPREYHDRFEKILTQEAGPVAAETPKPAPKLERKETALLKVPVKKSPPSTPTSSTSLSTLTQDDSAKKKAATPLPKQTADGAAAEPLEFYGVTLDSLDIRKDHSGSGRRGSVDSVSSRDSRMADPSTDESGSRGRDRLRTRSPTTRKRSDSNESVRSTSSQMSTSSRNYFEPTMPDTFAVVYKQASELCLAPDADAKKILAKAVQKLGSGDWKEEFQALDDLRAVVATQAELVESTQNRSDVVRKVHACVSNVRHCVIVNALMCLEDMFRVFKLSMDGYVAFLLPTMVKRVIDTKEKILSEAATATMTALMECTTPARTLKLLYTLWTDDRNLATKNCCTRFAGVTIARLGPAVAEKAVSELVVTYVGPMMHDRQEEHRRHAKEVLILLCNAHTTAGTTGELKASIDKLVVEKFRDRAQTLVKQALAGEVPPEREPPPPPKPIVTKPKTVETKKEDTPVADAKKKEKGERQSLFRTKEELAALEKMKEEAQSKRSSEAPSIKLDFSTVQSKVGGNMRTKEELAELDRQKEGAQKSRSNDPATVKLDFSNVQSKVGPILRDGKDKDETGSLAKEPPLPRELRPTRAEPPKPVERQTSALGKCTMCGSKTVGDVKFCSSCSSKRVSLVGKSGVVVANAGIVRKTGLVPPSPKTAGAAGADLMAEINALANKKPDDDDETF